MSTLDPDELEALDVYPWQRYRRSFKEADLLLGNGFSINLSSALRYDSLFDEFISTCDKNLAKIVSQFGTTNFERIQGMMEDAKKVAGLFGLQIPTIDGAINNLRNGLVAAVQKCHPVPAALTMSKFASLAAQFVEFNNVFTVNYDLFLYYIIMAAKDMNGRAGALSTNLYNDYFWNKIDDRFLGFMDYQDIEGYRHVYYLHGALFLSPLRYFVDAELESGIVSAVRERKLRRDSDAELIKCVEREILAGRMPLFVSEGSASAKYETIAQSPYLMFALRKLERARKRLLIFGWSASDQDDHLVDAINQRDRTVAVAAYVTGKNKSAVKQEVHRIKSRLSKHDVVVVDASTVFQFV